MNNLDLARYRFFVRNILVGSILCRSLYWKLMSIVLFVHLAHARWRICSFLEVKWLSKISSFFISCSLSKVRSINTSMERQEPRT